MLITRGSQVQFLFGPGLFPHEGAGKGLPSDAGIRQAERGATTSLLFEEEPLDQEKDRPFGPVAQLGERLICIQEVSGSIPLRSTSVA